MKKLFVLIGLLAIAADARAQSVYADRFVMRTGPCTIRSGTGSPGTMTGCDVYIDASSGRVYIATAISAPGNLTINPVGDLIVDPAGGDMLPASPYAVNLGSLQQKFLTLHAAELWVETLVAQNTIATIGGRVIVAPTNLLTANLSAASSVITVKYNNLAVLDILYMEANGQVEFFQVGSVIGGGFPGAYSYTVTRNLDGSGANTWSAGDAIVNTGQAGNGFIDLYSVRGVRAGTEIGPAIVMNVRNSTTYNDWSPRAVFGNCNGLYGYATNIYCVALGVPTAAWVKIDPTNGVRIGYNTTTAIQLDASGNASFAGTITSSAGSIGGWLLTSDGTGGGYLYSGATSTARVGLHAQDTSTGVAIYAGDNNEAIAPFRVLHNGALFASNVNITGAVTATSGSFTGAVTATSGSFTGAITATSGTFTGTVNASTITGGTISSGTTISGVTISGSTIRAGSGNEITLDASGIMIATGHAARNIISWTDGTWIGGWDVNTLDLHGPVSVIQTGGTTSTRTAFGSFVGLSGANLGDSSNKWGEVWIAGDVHQTPGTTTSADQPMVYSVGNGIYYRKTNGYSGTCSAPTSITVENGIVTACS